MRPGIAYCALSRNNYEPEKKYPPFVKRIFESAFLLALVSYLSYPAQAVGAEKEDSKLDLAVIPKLTGYTKTAAVLYQKQEIEPAETRL